MKRLFLICLLLCMGLRAFPQATSMTIDNHTPGWLSSRITYENQQTLRNLKVTGYINATDLNFIGTLINLRNLDGELDLSEVNVVSETSGGKDNILVGLGISKKDSIRVYRIPKSIENASACTNKLHVDTLFFDCKMKYIDCTHLDGINSSIGCLYLGESVDSIPGQNMINHKKGKGFCEVKNVKKVFFPKTMRYISDLAFLDSGIEYINLQDLNNLEYIGAFAFVNYHSANGLSSKYCPDTLFINATSLNASAFAYAEKTKVFIGERCKTVETGEDTKRHYGFVDNMEFHMESSEPPTGHAPNETCTVYIPKGAKNSYLNSAWRDATIIEAKPVEEIWINFHDIELTKGNRIQLTTTIVPSNADDCSIVWSSSNEQVATVDDKGNVTAKKGGETWIKAISLNNPEAKDSCKVTVIQPVSGISLNYNDYELDGIGESVVLIATIVPDDASNKNVKWTSSNESVCVVSRGTVVGVGYGTAVIIANTEDGEYMATCKINVTNATNISSVEHNESGKYNIYNVNGSKLSRMQKGINIIRFNDGISSKVLVK